jgi:hypothetical protein
MVYKISASPLATASYKQNIAFLEKNWSEKEVTHFITKVSEVIAILKMSPQTFQKWDRNRGIYKIEIVKQITLYYQINTENIELLVFFNNLQDPTILSKLV